MKITDLEVVIDHVRGSYKKFADTVEQYPVLGVTFPTHYGYIKEYIGEDQRGLDVFLGTGNLLGYIRFERKEAMGGVETKMFLHISEEELDLILKEYEPVVQEVAQFETEDDFLEYIERFRGKGVQRVGVILYTQKYDELVAFYKEIFNPIKLFEVKQDDSSVIALDIQGTYIMIETIAGKDIVQNPGTSVRLRFNVGNVQEFSDRLTEMSIAHEHNSTEWGEVADFEDIDGNTISIRDEKGFVEQS